MDKRKFKETEIGMIPEDWEVKQLGQCIKVIKKQIRPLKESDIKYIGLEHIEQQTLRLNGIGSSVDIESNKFEFRNGQILFGKLRPYFRKVYRPKFDGVCSTDIWVIDTKGDNDPSFFFYFLADERIINEADNSSEGTKMPRARWDYLEKLEFPIPKPVEQRSIASILSSLDDKIELNQQMNATLERIGQALFKHWFIDFEFPDEKGRPYKSSGGEMVDSELGEIPKGWGVKTIEEVVTVKGGSTPSTTNLSYWNDGNIYWCTPKDLSSLSVPVLLKTERMITQEGLSVISSGLLPKGTLLLSSRAPIGYLAISEIPVAINQGFIAIVCNKNISNYYMLFWVKNNMDLIKSKAHGTTFEEINKASFRGINILSPPSDLLNQYDILIERIYSKMMENEKQINVLSQIRDSLLPRLMSGRIRVPVEATK